MDNEMLQDSTDLDDLDRAIINEGQADFPLVTRPFAALGERLGLSEAEMLARVRRLQEAGYISRLGPVLHPRKLGGISTLAAMKVPEERLEKVIAQVNACRQVSQNYLREHEYNVWFVASGADAEELAQALADLEKTTGLPVLDLPMLEEYFVGVNFQV
ncbi:MAG: Lrp/AsnC family transcriptional regulator [Bacteroidetes bacterium]|nr:Lrp/AsnC family transcriptional regulator [Bacteroidota bacterium]